MANIPVTVKINGTTPTPVAAVIVDDATGAADTNFAAMATAIGTAADAAGDPTVIGLLKQIMANTDPG